MSSWGGEEEEEEDVDGAAMESAAGYLAAAGGPPYLTRLKTLVLDIAHRPIDVVNWQRAISLDIFSKVDVLEYYDAVVHSASQEWPLPAVVRIKVYVRTKGAATPRVSLCRKNILIRDNFQCQYCASRQHLTMDHVVPLSKGGPFTWENVVTACSACNIKKADKLLSEARGMRLKNRPTEPSVSSSAAFSIGYYRQLPAEWTGYLSQAAV